MFFGLTFEKLLLIGVIAVFLLGPDRLPGYAAKLAQLIRSLRDMARGAKDRMRDEMGPEFDDVDWSAYDPRQYDPRRIVREALAETWEDTVSDTKESTVADDAAGPETGADGRSDRTDRSDRAGGPGAGRTGSQRAPGYAALHDPTRPVPFDTDAT